MLNSIQSELLLLEIKRALESGARWSFSSINPQ